MANENCIISIRNRKSHNARFYQILIALSNFDVEWKFFRETLNFLCVPELEEIVEERISKNKCGYVLCNNLININPTAIYSLNITKRKIFNISNRKKYCSNWCYGAFKHICNQVPSEPLWKTKDKFTDKIISLYPKTEYGCEGEIYFNEDLDTVDNMASGEIAINDCNQSKQKCASKKIIQNPIPGTLVNKINKPNDILEKPKREEIMNNVINSLDKLAINKKKTLEEVENNNTKIIQNPIPGTLVNKINKPNDILEKPKREEIMNNVINSLDKLAINKKKTLEEVVNKIKAKTTNNPERKLKFINEYLNDSDMVLIPSDEESLVALQKIKFVISGWITEDTRDFICDSPKCDLDEDSDNQDNTYDKTIDNEECELLPTLDSEDQMTIRRNILMRKAKMSCISILGDFDIEPNYFLGEFEKLIYTCRLTAKNITFSSKEFKWFIIVIVDLLSSKFGKVDDDKKAFILKKHGLSQYKLYEKVLKEINSHIYQLIDISLSPQGDSTECK